MSTLTKALILFLSLFSIFLCGAVVTYVGSANNYKTMYQTQKSMNDSLKNEAKSKSQLYIDKQNEMKQLEKELRDSIAALTDENNRLTGEIRDAKRESLSYRQQTESWKGLLESFEKDINAMEQSRALLQSQLDQDRQARIEERRRLNEIEASLYEKIAQMQALDAERRKYLEQKTSLEEKLSQIGTTGSMGAQKPMSDSVTQPIDSARPSFESAPVSSDVRGVVSEVRNSLVTVTVGSADGVRKGMVFHATRGDEFLCDIVITDVDINKSAGILELVQERPKIGDTVSTSL